MRRIWMMAAAALPLVACSSGPFALLREATGAVSQTLCSKTFVSGLAPEDVHREHLRPQPGMGLIDWALRYDVDREQREVSARVFGGFESRAVYRDGRGCTLVYAGHPLPTALQARPSTTALLPEIGGPAVVEAKNGALRDAIDAAFAEPETGPARATKAIVVVHDGRIIGERYAAGYGVDTPLLAHSVSKSVINALIGILVRRGDFTVSDRAPIAAWQQPGDPRARITIDELLRMDAGFGFDEGGGVSASTHMWFSEPDNAAFAETAQLHEKPGTWGYSSRSYTILSRIIGDAVGGDPQSVRDFAQRELFDPLGMHSAVMEFDTSGTAMGANAFLATPRDWARFGLLYLDDGVAGGQRILPEDWVAYSTRPTGDSGYGAGFWLNTTNAIIPRWGMAWGLPGAPRDAFMARGYLGQYVVVVPSENLVIVRFGLSHGRGADVASVGSLVHDVIESLHAPPATAE